MSNNKRKIRTLKEREFYNEAVRDTLKEVWLYDGVIPDEVSREYMVRKIQRDISYKKPEWTPLNTINHE